MSWLPHPVVPPDILAFHALLPNSCDFLLLAIHSKFFLAFLLRIYFLVWWCTALLPLPWESQGPRMHSHGDNFSSPRLLYSNTAPTLFISWLGPRGRGKGIPAEINQLRPRVCCEVAPLQQPLPLIALSPFFFSFLAAAADCFGLFGLGLKTLRRCCFQRPRIPA